MPAVLSLCSRHGYHEDVTHLKVNDMGKDANNSNGHKRVTVKELRAQLVALGYSTEGTKDTSTKTSTFHRDG